MMGWESGRATLRKDRGVWKQNPQMLIVPDRDSFFTVSEAKKVARFLKDHGLEEDTTPYISNRKAKHKWKRKPQKKGGEISNGYKELVIIKNRMGNCSPGSRDGRDVFPD